MSWKFWKKVIVAVVAIAVVTSVVVATGGLGGVGMLGLIPACVGMGVAAGAVAGAAIEGAEAAIKGENVAGAIWKGAKEGAILGGAVGLGCGLAVPGCAGALAQVAAGGAGAGLAAVEAAVCLINGGVAAFAFDRAVELAYDTVNNSAEQNNEQNKNTNQKKTKLNKNNKDENSLTQEVSVIFAKNEQKISENNGLENKIHERAEGKNELNQEANAKAEAVEEVSIANNSVDLNSDTLSSNQHPQEEKDQQTEFNRENYSRDNKVNTPLFAAQLDVEGLLINKALSAVHLDDFRTAALLLAEVLRNSPNHSDAKKLSEILDLYKKISTSDHEEVSIYDQLKRHQKSNESFSSVKKTNTQTFFSDDFNSTNTQRPASLAQGI